MRNITQSLVSMPNLLSEALFIKIRLHIAPPKSWSRRKRLNAVSKPHVYKPDVSNLVKFIEDALNEVIWKDDSFISGILVTKTYELEAKTIITVEPYDEVKMLALFSN